MRTNIEIDDELMAKAMAATGTTTKKAAVEAALRQVLQLEAQKGILKWRGKIAWRGHDDDWLATDEEIREKRRREEASAETGPDRSAETGQLTAAAGEVR